MEQKDNTGALFANDKKTAENHPDYNGKCMVDGKMKDLAAWVKTSKSGQKYQLTENQLKQLTEL